jgi:phosphoribosylaminoimidazolecarboxamide formyltransferase/IMP cyclohydrolase
MRRDEPEDVEQARAHGIDPIDLLVVDLYPYEQGLEAGRGEDVELIDIGGPALLRAAAKNHAHVAAVCDRGDYERVARCLEEVGGVPGVVRRELAGKAFARTSAYDAVIAARMGRDRPLVDGPDWRAWSGRKLRDLRYGENPGQKGALYAQTGSVWDRLRLHQGKDLSFNNLLDLVRGALVMREFSGGGGVAATVVKHGIPAGTAVRDGVEEALEAAWNGDSLSAFGGVVLLNGEATSGCAEFLRERFFEVAAAPRWRPEALEILSKKRTRILLTWDLLESDWEPGLLDTRWALDGLLLQEPLAGGPEVSAWTRAAGEAPAPGVLSDLDFAWKVVRHVRSNAIVLAKGGRTVGVGAGQTSRIDALEIAVHKADRCGHELSGAVLASDAFFPFADVVERAAQAGIGAIVQPGGSLRDEESVDACRRHGIVLYLTGQRVFTH